MKKFLRILVYFFTPEPSDHPTQRGGDISFSMGLDQLSMGSAKVMFWIFTTGLIFYLISLI